MDDEAWLKKNQGSRRHHHFGSSQPTDCVIIIYGLNMHIFDCGHTVLITHLYESGAGAKGAFH